MSHVQHFSNTPDTKVSSCIVNVMYMSCLNDACDVYKFKHILSLQRCRMTTFYSWRLVWWWTRINMLIWMREGNWASWLQDRLDRRIGLVAMEATDTLLFPARNTSVIISYPFCSSASSVKLWLRVHRDDHKHNIKWYLLFVTSTECHSSCYCGQHGHPSDLFSKCVSVKMLFLNQSACSAADLFNKTFHIVDL